VPARGKTDGLFPRHPECPGRYGRRLNSGVVSLVGPQTPAVRWTRGTAMRLSQPRTLRLTAFTLAQAREALMGRTIHPAVVPRIVAEDRQDSAAAWRAGRDVMLALKMRRADQDSNSLGEMRVVRRGLLVLRCPGRSEGVGLGRAHASRSPQPVDAAERVIRSHPRPRRVPARAGAPGARPLTGWGIGRAPTSPHAPRRSTPPVAANGLGVPACGQRSTRGTRAWR
jgi:hypothetical protein